MVRYGELKEPPAWVMMLVKINHLLLTVNSAANILIYSYKVLDKMYAAAGSRRSFVQDFKVRLEVVST